MTEVLVRDGSWTFNGDVIRIVPAKEGVPDGPSDRFLLPGPPVPLTANASDALITFDGDLILIEFNCAADASKRKAGPQRIALADLAAVEWIPNGGMENGRLRFTRRDEPSTRPPIKHDHPRSSCAACANWARCTATGC